jgi:hypothetical protein
VKVLFVKYNRERKPKFQIETKIGLQGDSLVVTKRALTPEALEHIKTIYDNFLMLRRRCRGVSISTATLHEGEVVLEFIRGKSLEGFLIDAVLRRNREEFFVLLDRYVNFLKMFEMGKGDAPPRNDRLLEVFGRPLENQDIRAPCMANLDLTFDNIIIDAEGNYRIIDYEWVFEFALPMEFLIYRSVKRFNFKYREYLEAFVALPEILAHVNIDVGSREAFDKMEEGFQEYVYGKYGRDRVYFIPASYQRGIAKGADDQGPRDKDERRSGWPLRAWRRLIGARRNLGN